MYLVRKASELIAWSGLESWSHNFCGDFSELLSQDYSLAELRVVLCQVGTEKRDKTLPVKWV